MTVLVYFTATFQKKISQSKSSDKVAQFWPKFTLGQKTLFTKREFIEKLSNIALVFYVPSCYIISGKS